MKYRKKPIVIDAWKYDGDIRTLIGVVPIRKNEEGDIFIPTLEGDMKISDGDYIIKGVKGEFYPCKPDIFEATYEKVGTEDLEETD